MRYIILFCLLTSCQSDVLYKQQIKIPQAKWAYNFIPKYEWEIKDTALRYDILLLVNHTLDAKYQNTYVQLLTQYPDAKVYDNSLSLELFEANGKPQGKCTANDCIAEIALQENVYFPQLGKYHIEIKQNTRDSIIDGIKSIELIIHKKDNKLK